MVGIVEKWWKITSRVGNIDLTWKKKIGTEVILILYNIYRKGPNDAEYIKSIVIWLLIYTIAIFVLLLVSMLGEWANGQFEYPIYSYKISSVANGQESILSEISKEGSAINPSCVLSSRSFGNSHHWVVEMVGEMPKLLKAIIQLLEIKI